MNSDKEAKGRAKKELRRLDNRMAATCAVVGTVVGALVASQRIDAGLDPVWYFGLFMVGGALLGLIIGYIWP
jgi:hypothetical protein